MLQAGGAGAAAMGVAACGDDYFEPKTEHGSDAPNALLIMTDSTRADYIGHYNPRSLAKTPNLDALARDSLSFSLAVPEAMPTGPARRGLLSGVRSFPYRDYVPTKGLPVGPGWSPIPDHFPLLTETMGDAGIETAYCTDNPFLVGPRFANFRRTVDEVRPSYSQGAYRFLNKPFKRPATRSSIERYLLPELSDSVEVGRLRSMAGWNSIYRRRDTQFPTARVVRSGINLLDDLKKRRPFFLGVDAFDPHEPLDAPTAYQLAAGRPKGIETSQGIIPIQPFETPYSWAVDVEVGGETVQRVRELYAAEVTFIDEWIGRLMNELADQQLLDETVVYYLSDHGLTLGEHGVLGKHGARAQWHIYHVPAMIRHPEGKRAGEWSDFFAATHDVPRTLLGFMGVRAPGMMDGEDLSVLFDGGQPAQARPYFTSCYDNHVLCGDRDWFLLADSEGRRKRLYDKRNDPRELSNVASEHPQIVDRLWRVLEEEAGGTLPQFGSSGARTVIGG
ncbi:MAG: sulfatase [Thermoleophilaceae bacterium]|nr:sulfatase [Thermoleophilaceae bacterium]